MNKGLTFANKITICRILIVPFFISAILSYTPERDYLRYIALGIFIFAAFSDFVDGYIARTHQQKTAAGAILDPLADKILLISAFICLYVMRDGLGHIEIPIWLVVAVISRDAMLLLGWMIVYIKKGRVDIAASIWGKITAFLQMVCILGILVKWNLSMVVWDLTFIFTLVSTIDYIREGIRILNTGESI